MNKITKMLFFFAALIALMSTNLDIFYESNRIIHIIGSLLLTVILFKLRPTWLILSVVFFVGFYKELLDPVFDYLDILANCVGIVLGYVICKVLK